MFFPIYLLISQLLTEIRSHFTTRSQRPPQVHHPLPILLTYPLTVVSNTALKVLNPHRELQSAPRGTHNVHPNRRELAPLYVGASRKGVQGAALRRLVVYSKSVPFNFTVSFRDWQRPDTITSRLIARVPFVIHSPPQATAFRVGYYRIRDRSRQLQYNRGS